MARLAIRGGTLVDGTGRPGIAADVVIEGGRVTEIGSLLHAEHELDAAGCVVAPGFVDPHTHYDAQVFWDPALTPSSWHGVTTVVAGNCGFSLAPLRPEHRALMIETLQGVEDMIPDTLRAGVDWDAFGSYRDYLDAIERRGVRINFGGFVGHTAVRMHAMGDEASERAATPDELAAMKSQVADAIDAGALGFATSSSLSHSFRGGRPVASRLGDLDELLTLVEPLRDARRGVIEMLPGERIGFDDVYTVQRHIDRPVTFTPMVVMANFPHEALLARNRVERDAGADVWPQTAVRPIVFAESVRSPFNLTRFPAIAQWTTESESVRLTTLGDPDWRERVRAEVEAAPLDWAAVRVAASPSQPLLEGEALADLVPSFAPTALDALLDLARADQLETRISIPVANADVDAVAPILQTEGVLLGLGDAGAHVGQLCDACYPTDLLGTWVRERGVLSIEDAVHKLTGEPARFLGLRDRGTIEIGQAADVCVFDPDTVAPGRLRRVADLPAHGERLLADAATGVRHVVVNGTPIRVDGHDVDRDARPGVILRSR